VYCKEKLQKFREGDGLYRLCGLENNNPLNPAWLGLPGIIHRLIFFLDIAFFSL